MTQSPEQFTGVGEDVAAAIDDRARRAELFRIATGDLSYLAQHGDIELLRAVRDLNLHPDSPDSHRHAHDLQRIRDALGRALAILGFEDAIVHEPLGEIAAPSRKARPPIVDVELQ